MAFDLRSEHVDEKPYEKLSKEWSRERELEFPQLNGWIILPCVHFFVSAARNAFRPTLASPL